MKFCVSPLVKRYPYHSTTVNKWTLVKPRNLQMKTVNFNLKNVSCMLDDIQSSSFLKSLTIHGLTTLPSVFKNVPVLRELSSAQLTHSQMLRVMCKTTLLVSLILRKITCIADNSCGCQTSLLKILKTKATRMENLFVEKVSVSFAKHITQRQHI